MTRPIVLVPEPPTDETRARRGQVSALYEDSLVVVAIPFATAPPANKPEVCDLGDGYGPLIF